MPEFLKYDGVDGDVRGPSSPKADGTSNTVMVAEQNPALGGPDTFSLGGPDTFSLGGPDTSSLGGPDTFDRNSGQQDVSTDGGYVLTSVSHTATLNAPETDWLVA